MILIALGANLDSKYGAPAETLAAARQEIARRGMEIVQFSRTWLSAPVPVSDQPWYHNGVIQVHTSLQPDALLAVLQDIETDFGRVRGEKNAPRMLDLDLLAYNDMIKNRGQAGKRESGLVLPHPEMHRRAFVLLPMADIVPGWVHPVSGRSLMNLICDLPPGQEARPLPEEKKKKTGGRT